MIYSAKEVACVMLLTEESRHQHSIVTPGTYAQLMTAVAINCHIPKNIREEFGISRHDLMAIVRKLGKEPGPRLMALIQREVGFKKHSDQAFELIENTPPDSGPEATP